MKSLVKKKQPPQISRVTKSLAAAWLVPLFAVLFATPALGLDLAYSFESDLQGFGQNGPGITITQDTIGATEGTSSMKVAIVQPATFVGALTDQLDPFIANPPGLDFILFDLTLTEQFPEEAGFVDIGITLFGVSQPGLPGEQLDLSVQFFDNQVSLGDLPVGTHEIRMDLTEALHPITFVPASFNEIFGVEGSGDDDVIPTGFQFYINKSGDAPWTGYFDNIRTGTSVAGDYNNNGTVDAADYTVWRDNVGGTGPAGDGTTTGDLLGIPDGVVDQFDYDYWVQEFGAGGSEGVGVPEPSSCLLLMSAFLMLGQGPVRKGALRN